MEKVRKSKKGSFIKKLLIYILCFLILSFAGLSYFWKYINAYEMSQPDNFMNQFMSDFTIDSIKNLILENENILHTEFEDKNVILEKIFDSISKNADFKYTKIPGEYTASPVYSIHGQDADICKVVLTSKGKNSAGYGFDLWKPESITISDLYINPVSYRVSIIVPEGTNVFLNGIFVSDEYITDSQVAYKGFEHISQPFDKRPTGKRYDISGIYLTPVITASDISGNPVSLSFEHDCNRFDYSHSLIIEKTYSYRISAPKDSDVYVNDIVLTNEYAINAPYYYHELETVKNYLTTPVMTVYEINDLYNEPVIKSISHEKTPDTRETTNRHIVFRHTPSQELEQRFKSEALEFSRTYINFTTNATGDVYGYFGVLAGYLIDGSVLHERLKSARSSLWWVMGSTLEYKYLDVSNFVRLSDTAFTCTMSFSVTNKTYYETRELENSFYLVYILHNGKWKVADMLSDLK